MKLNTLSKGLVFRTALDGVTKEKDLTPYSAVPTLGGGIVVGNQTDRHGQANRSSLWDGGDDRIVITDQTSIQNIFATGGSLSIWINPASSGGGTYGRIVNKGNGNNLGFVLAVQEQSGSAMKIAFSRYGAGTKGAWVSDNLVIPVNDWTHFTITYNNSNNANDPIFYVNSVSVAITETNTPVGAAGSDVGIDMYIGNISTLNRGWDGKMDTLRLYKRILTQPEITLLYDSYRPKIVYNYV